MHIYDKGSNFQGGWALVAEQLPYAVGAARSILLDRHLSRAPPDDDRITVVFVGEGGAQNGRMAECLNAAAKENLPLLFVVIDNGRAINTFTPDVAQNSDVYVCSKTAYCFFPPTGCVRPNRYLQGLHYGVPGVKIDGQNMEDTIRTARAVVDHVRSRGPAILQVHTFRFTGHSPADPEHERWGGSCPCPCACVCALSERPTYPTYAKRTQGREEMGQSRSGSDQALRGQGSGLTLHSRRPFGRRPQPRRRCGEASGGVRRRVAASAQVPNPNLT
jgi:hypothetical protein